MECYHEHNYGEGYRGFVSKTENGIDCQRWDSQTPHSHSWVPESYPLAGLDRNYCRNSFRSVARPWCWTTDEKVRWDYCNVPKCSDTTLFYTAKRTTTLTMPTRTKVPPTINGWLPTPHTLHRVATTTTTSTTTTASQKMIVDHEHEQNPETTGPEFIIIGAVLGGLLLLLLIVIIATVLYNRRKQKRSYQPPPITAESITQHPQSDALKNFLASHTHQSEAVIYTNLGVTIANNQSDLPMYDEVAINNQSEGPIYSAINVDTMGRKDTIRYSKETEIKTTH